MRKVAPFLILDVWRGVAALWVVMIHSCLSFLATGDNMRLISNPLYAVSVWGQLGVVIFFVISGYCIMGAAYSTLAAGRTAARFGLDRIRRIYPPYLAVCLFIILVSVAIGFAQQLHFLPPQNHPGAPHAPLFWISNLFLVHIEYDQPSLLIVAWSLCYEIVFYLFIGLLLAIAQLVTRNSGPARGVSIFHAGIGGLTLLSLGWRLLTPHLAMPCPFPFDRWYQFGLGSLIFLMFAAEPGRQLLWTRAQLGVAALLTLIYAVEPASTPFRLGYPSSHIQAATCLVFAVILCLLRPWDATLAHLRVLRPLMWLGTFSYSLYLVHPVILPYLDAGGRHLGLDHSHYWMTWLIQIAAAVITGWIFFLLVEPHFISSRQKQRVKEELTEELAETN